MCGPWDCGPETSTLSECRACWNTAKAPMAPAHDGQGGAISGGVFDHSTHEEDGPETWEALALSRHITALRRAGDPSPAHGTLVGARIVGPRGTEQAPASR